MRKTVCDQDYTTVLGKSSFHYWARYFNSIIVYVTHSTQLREYVDGLLCDLVGAHWSVEPLPASQHVWVAKRSIMAEHTIVIYARLLCQINIRGLNFEGIWYHPSCLENKVLVRDSQQCVLKNWAGDELVMRSGDCAVVVGEGDRSVFGWVDPWWKNVL